MILTPSEARKFITSNKTDGQLELMLKGIETAIRGYTHNNFQFRGVRFYADVTTIIPYSGTMPFAVDDTIEINNSIFNTGLYVIKKITDAELELSKPLIPENNILVTKVVYPDDIKMGVVNLLNWDLQHRDKVGIASETISRHSVSYSDPSGDNSTLGYPNALTGFLKPYMKARF